MKLAIGIVGLPNVGKSTLFKLLTKQEVLIANYPFATIDPNVGVVPVPDERLTELAEISRSKKVVPAVVEFYDIAGLVRGANKGEGLGNQFLAHIRECQAIVIVLRVFKNLEIIHIEHTVDPLRDLEIITVELILKDLETIEKKLDKTEGDARAGKKEALAERGALLEIKKRLESGKLLVGWDSYSNVLKNIRIRELNLLTGKKQVYLLNGDEADVPGALKDKIGEMGGGYVVANLAAAGEISELIRKAYEILDLISFFTTGEDETRAWTIEKDMKAPQAAGVIHSDFEKNFIRAEVISCDQLLQAGSWSAAKAKGWIRLEGRDYIVQDGDVIVVRHG